MWHDEALVERWHVATGPDLQDEIVRRLQTGEALDGLPVERVDGRWDLRGLGVPQVRTVEPDQREPMLGGTSFTFEFAALPTEIELQNAHLADLDLRGAHLPRLRLFGCVLDNCRFDGAYLVGLRMWATDVLDCTFTAAELARSSVGGWYANRPNRLRGVDFSHADLTRLGCGVAGFTEVDFSHAQLACTNFWQASLVRCTFAGALREVVFDGRVLERDRNLGPNPMLDVDMGRVTAFDDVDFRGVNFDRVTLPAQLDLLVVRDTARIDAGIAVLEGCEDQAALVALGRLQYLRRFMGVSGGSDQALLDFGAIADRAAAELLRSLLAG
ncbi:hypothetical protein Cs7R123_17400 [Catellatospora sp. TT07R-123]|uniref:pentapeptide repeat-containing protein n=1 Tax=Catellatospora sp. TT07R-123 TaxID=2733863 RepID=UPI001B1FF729|nr:pentapeptide repeat-containing protein [Catellatospora sp. TT07R-123]GHJ44398.1 hypothetical protein Cs7R123_17400 [Catellatospora sp. TT07R-123]